MKTLSFFILAMLVVSCSTKYVPVESVRVDSVHVERVRRDSVVLRDSVYILHRGDTVFKTKYKYLYRDRVLRDTFYHVKCDTVTKVVKVEKELSFWQKKKICFADAFLYILPFLLLYIIYRIKR